LKDQMHIEYPKRNFLIILIAPSGGGKSTILARVQPEMENMVYSISYTTRKPRGEEKHGIHYFFVEEDEFLRRKDEGEFLEFANVHGNWYGTSRKFIEKRLSEGKHVILDIDVQGADSIVNSGIDTVTIFLLPPNTEILKERLIKRGTDSEEAINLRLVNSVAEIEKIPDYQYLVINDDLDETVENVKQIIISEEKRTFRYTKTSELFYGGENAE